MTLPLDGRRILVGVGGSVAAFKACQVVTDLRRDGAEVKVAMTEAATHFVTPRCSARSADTGSLPPCGRTRLPRLDTA